MTRSRRQVPFRRESVETPDGDELLLDHVDGPPGSPRLLVLHGLEGSSYSVYVQGLLAGARARGWRGVAVNFRSCARRPENLSAWLPNRRPRLYHSGETSDLDFVVRRLSSEDPGAPLLAAGVSLGGNVLLKWLGENAGQSAIFAAAAISVPYDLGAGATHMDAAFGRFYVRIFLKSLRVKAADLAARFPKAAERIDLTRALSTSSFRGFDDAATGPLHGFTGAADYYARSSSLGFIGGIATPTLCLSSGDDPFLPARVLEEAKARASSSIDFRTTPRGGHIGFVSASGRFWAEETALEWMEKKLRV
ncbi:MAG: alpha/beta fold hydrolase [Acidobacteria bacterium]|nr:alpha/beta fold hydrolase [Acidobacteriota bacterium]MCA1611943.1 alpha/beta fold hydrolase [Acidobacteriota bacterium]